MLTVYSELVYALLDSYAISDVIPRRLTEKLKLDVNTTNRRIILANGASKGFSDVVDNVPVGSGSAVTRLKLLVMDSVSFDIKISDTKQIKLRMKIDDYYATVKVKMNEKSDTLNLKCEPDIGHNTDYNSTSDNDSEEGTGRKLIT